MPSTEELDCFNDLLRHVKKIFRSHFLQISKTADICSLLSINQATT